MWDTWTEIRSAYEGNFMERFSPGSMTKTLSESTPKVLFQHGRDQLIGDKPLGTITRLEPDSTGAFYEVELLDTAYVRELVPGLRADLYGASHRFSVVQEDFVQRPKRSDYNPRGIPERTVTEARVMEFGPVTFGAYPTATAGIRSMTDEFLFDALAEDPERLRALCTRAGISLNGVDTPFVTGTYGDGVVINFGAPNTTFDVTRFNSSSASFVASRDVEPEEPAPTTPTPDEPEPPGATTPSDRGLFLFTDPPEHLKRS